MAPKSPVMVIIVSVVISGLCTGHPVSRSCLYSFLQNMQILVRRGLHRKTREHKVYLSGAVKPLSWWKELDD